MYILSYSMLKIIKVSQRLHSIEKVARREVVNANFLQTKSCLMERFKWKVILRVRLVSNRTIVKINALFVNVRALAIINF